MAGVNGVLDAFEGVEKSREFDEGLADPGHPTHVHCHRGIPCRVVQMRYIDDEVLAALRIQRVLIKSLPPCNNYDRGV